MVGTKDIFLGFEEARLTKNAFSYTFIGSEGIKMLYLKPTLLQSKLFVLTIYTLSTNKTLKI